MSERPQFKGPFVMVPTVLLADNELKNDALRLWCFIYDLCGMKGHCWASNETLGKHIGKSESTVKRYLKILKLKGYIDADYSSNNNNTERQITIIPEFFERFNKPVSRSKMSRKQIIDELPSGSEMSHKRFMDDPLSITIDKKLNNNIEATASKVFTKFISVVFIPNYPKKVKQDMIWSEVTKLIEEHKDYTVEQWKDLCMKIRKHLPYYIKSTDFKYLVAPFNYLAARKWEEPINEKPTSNPKDGGTNSNALNKLKQKIK